LFFYSHAYIFVYAFFSEDSEGLSNIILYADAPDHLFNIFVV
jgi:hypothetical protein